MQTVDNREKEVKFFISDPLRIRDHVLAHGARLQKERLFEMNLRFDTSQQTLRASHQVLRLRQDDHVRLTYKDQSEFSEGIADRRELEVTVSDFETTRSVLEALGFEVFMIYEKYRTTFTLDPCEIVIDEMPFGNFIEIEGPSADIIHDMALRLGLDWEKRITVSYLDLFYGLKDQKKLSAPYICFEYFKRLGFKEEDFTTGIDQA
ncbi:MAG: class IV adenylate cyclase [Chloroflexi bacterium]|nr:class IV adenylate cyclase [Chloroflexota bacterium]